MDADRPPPWFRTVAESVKDPSGATVVLLTSGGATTRSGPGTGCTVSATPAEQLFPVSLSPLTGSTQAP